MSNETTRRDHDAPRGRRRRMLGLRTVPATAAASPDAVRLASSSRCVFAADIVRDPNVAMLVAEDACWQIWSAQSEADRPQPWRLGARARWRAERAELERKRLRLVDLAYDVLALRRGPA